jgi:hypothetical protein
MDLRAKMDLRKRSYEDHTDDEDTGRDVVDDHGACMANKEWELFDNIEW